MTYRTTSRIRFLASVCGALGDRTRSLTAASLPLALVTAALFSSLAVRDLEAQVPGVSREQMWYAPTEEDWKKPVQITFQRTWEDAVALSKESNRPILACINMDGEIASEHYAGIRYRMPEIAALYEPYVCVIASVYRHTPRDYDDEGRRILCPRFGSVTCGEHIAIEPILYEKYLDGNRVAPRHIMIELDGSETYDVYYARDTQSVFDTIENGMSDRDVPVKPIIRGDRPILERVTSRDVRDRAAVEQAYLNGDEQMRKALLEAAKENGEVVSPDLLRLAVFGFDETMSKLARDALATTESEAAIELIPEALRVPMPEEERKKLVGALERLGEKSESQRAQWLATVHSGLASESSTVKVDGWTDALQGAQYPAPTPDWVSLQEKLETMSAAADAMPASPERSLEFAETSLAFAIEASSAFGVTPTSEELLSADPATVRMIARSKYAEAKNAALEAEKLGAKNWRTDAVIALADYYLGDYDEAWKRSEAAVDALPPGVTDWNAMAVIKIFAEGRFKKMKKAVDQKRRWPSKWLTDVNSAYTILRHHPLATADEVAWHHDFLLWVGAKDRAMRVVQQGLERFTAAPALHERLRTWLLENKSIDALESTYDRMLADDDADPVLEWFAGLASFIAAEYHRRGNDLDAGMKSYDRCIEHYQSYIEENPDDRDTADFNIALAHSGRARIAFEREDWQRALDESLASYNLRPDAAGVLDGLSHTPASTGLLLLRRLKELGKNDMAATLQEALGKLDPEDLKEPFTSN